MKLLLLKTLLRRKRKDEGFTLPIVIAIGMVMVLLSAVELVRSGEDNIAAISQEGSADALAAAELGVSRYRDLLINNRVLAVHNSDNWTDSFIIGDSVATPVVLGKICTDTNLLNGWANTNTWRNISVNGTVIGSYRLVQYEYDRDGTFGDSNDNGILDDLEGGNTNDNLVFSQISDTGDIDEDNVIDRPFDAISNNHNDIDDDLESDAVGILTVQGKDTPANVTEGSVTQLQVTIPIGVNTQDLTNLSPALWIQQSTVSNIGNVNINSDGIEPSPPNPLNTRIFSESIADGDNSNDGNIVLYDPATAGSDGCGTPASLSNENTISDPRPLPPILNQTNFTSTFITSPSVLNVRTLNGDISDEKHSSYIPGSPVPNSYPSNYYNPDTEKIVLGMFFDETNNALDQPVGSGSQQAINSNITINGENEDVFYYNTGSFSLELGDGEAIIGDGDSRVILHVGGDLNITTGTQGVRLVNSRHSSEAINPATATTFPGIARFLEIHVDGNVNVSGDGTLDITGLLRVGGTVNISGSSTINVRGSIWTNNWNANSGATINIDTDQTIISGELLNQYSFFSITPERIPAPITYRPSGWETQEAD